MAPRRPAVVLRISRKSYMRKFLGTFRRFIPAILLAAVLGAAALAGSAGGVRDLFTYGGVDAAPIDVGGSEGEAGAGGGADLFRLHIIPHSDDPVHQGVKLVVRDAVMDYIVGSGPDGGWSSPEEASRWMAAHHTALEEVALGALARYGASIDGADVFGYGVRVETGMREFPDRETMGVTVPAGTYPATVIILGDGAGQNWWCVLFPSICFHGAAGFLPEDDDFLAVPAISPAGGGESDAAGNQSRRQASEPGRGRPSVSDPEVRWAWRDLFDGPYRSVPGGPGGSAHTGALPSPSRLDPASGNTETRDHGAAATLGLGWWRLWLATAGYSPAGPEVPGAELE